MIALLPRLANLDRAFPDGLAQVPPFDDLYHAKRMSYSAAHFPRVLEFDPERGSAGAFCHWPPPYDLVAGGLARLLGARSPREVLARVVFLPPLVTALFAGAIAAGVAARAGAAAGWVAGLGIALSPALVEVSQVSDIDHHFLEPVLLGAVVASLIALLESDERRLRRASALFGIALAAAFFVQTAFLVAAACAFLAVLATASRDRARLSAASTAFAGAALLVLLYRVTRPPGYPGGEWYLGYLHAAALLAAATSLMCLARSRARLLPSFALALLVGGVVFVAVPGAAEALIAGVGFISGDPQLDPLSELRPLLGPGSGSLKGALLFVGGGSLFVVPAAILALRARRAATAVVALFTVIYLVLTLLRIRFAVAGSVVFALAAALVVAELRRFGVAVRLGAVALAIVPGVLGTIPTLEHPVFPDWARPMLRAAHQLKARLPSSTRVLGPFTWGHLLGVVSGHPVIVDPFGAMPDRDEFDEAVRLPLETEQKVADTCRRWGVRFVVLESPYTGILQSLRVTGTRTEPFLRPGKDANAPATFTRRALASFWWRAYYDLGRERPEAGRWGRPFQHFRLVYSDAERTGHPGAFDGPLLQIWELVS